MLERIQLRLQLPHLPGEPAILLLLSRELRGEPAMTRQTIRPEHERRDAENGNHQERGRHSERETLARKRHRRQRCHSGPANEKFWTAITADRSPRATLPGHMTDATSDSDALRVPLRSDPPWLVQGLIAVTAASVAVVFLYFRALAPVAARPSPGLALLPGLAVATFAGAVVAWWGRRRGATLHLELKPHQLALADPSGREAVIDRTVPFGSLLVYDPGTGERALVLSQHRMPVMILDRSRAAKPGDAWERHTVRLDLGRVAVSPDSAHAVALSTRARLDPVLQSLEKDLADGGDLIRLRLPSGEALDVTPALLRVGSREFQIGKGAEARRIQLHTPQGNIVALSLLQNETSALLACQDASETLDAAGPSDAPDAYLPPLVWAALCALFAVDPGEPTAAAPSYRG